jgi:hypothetical protein
MEAWEGAASRARLARLVSEAKRAAFYADLRSQSAGLIDWLRSQAARLNAWGGRWDKRLLRSSAAGGAAVSYAPDPLGPAGKGEPLDRSGRPLPWRWERSLSRDFLGRYGLPLAGAAVALAMLGQLSSAPPLPPKEAAGVPDRRGLIYPAPVQPAPVQPPTPQQQQQQRVPASPKAPAPAEK